MRHLSSLAFIVIFLFVLFPSCKQVNDLFGKKKKAQVAAAIEQARLDSIRVVDSLKRAQDVLLALERDRENSIRLAEEARLASKYHIIVGSFYTPEYARNWVEVFKNQSYNAQILKMRGSRFELVSAESFSDFRTAFNKLLVMQENIIPDAWIYIDE